MKGITYPLLFGLCATLFLFCFEAKAEEEELETAGKSKPRIVYRTKTTVSFDDAVVEGNTNNPEGVYVVTPPEKEFGNLLKLRPNFHRELMRDSLLLK